MIGEWKFIIDRDPPSLNERLHNAGPTRWKYARLRDEWALLFTVERLRLAIPKATGKRVVTLQRLYNGRQQERDYGNLVGGCKLVIDAMVKCHLLQDDAPSMLDDTYLQQKSGRKGLLVTIREAP